MKSFLLTVIAVMLCAASAMAQDAAHEDIVIKVNGMVCDFCAQSVWKVFEEYDSVAEVDISLDEGTVRVHLKPGQTLGDAELDKAITYAGYDLVTITRNQHKG